MLSCPNCGCGISDGFAYLSGGAILLSEDRMDSVHEERLEAFLAIGFHGAQPDMRDSCGDELVDSVEGGQFDLHWCSVKCMRESFNEMFDRMESQSKR